MKCFLSYHASERVAERGYTPGYILSKLSGVNFAGLPGDEVLVVIERYTAMVYTPDGMGDNLVAAVNPGTGKVITVTLQRTSQLERKALTRPVIVAD